ncbi:stage II sporulation protein R [Texcoconibacillus texcoconensis]|uniref:Stage II sporulation protein R n=1 Tax=Texcoconibacillus texcoconensis TaxID=1095777 RepID=A0A840QRX2_9BACI|nr:stage II sporulation protein R [Texcoconibacillus texcoconensis]MBB5174090.1 stage II sporulation protein R [Texcoconibacillus texcoconensis]
MNQKAIIYLMACLIVLTLTWELDRMALIQKQANASGASEEVIPEDAVRLRILANSNQALDQEVKRTVRDEVNQHVTEWLQGIGDPDVAEQKIEEGIGLLEDIVGETLEKADLNDDYEVRFDEAQFPTKVYGGNVYSAGVYDAIVIEIGDGLGDNWWCVLFPPLCFLDFSNGDAVFDEEGEQASTEQSEQEETEVRFFFVDLFNNLFSTDE